MNTVNTDSSALVREVTITKGQWSEGSIVRWLKHINNKQETTAHAFFKFPGVLSCTTFERLCQGGLAGLLMCPLQDEGRREKTFHSLFESIYRV
jgi:hypothetical protein